MVAPIVKRFVMYHNTPQHQHYVDGFVQKPPFNLNTSTYIERNWGNRTDGRSWSWGPDSMPQGLHAKVSNKLYESFVGKLGETSSFGATLTAELRQTTSMVTGVVLRLVSAARNVKKLNFRGAASDLGLPYSERTIVRSWRRKDRYGRWRTIVQRRRVFTLPTGREVQKTLANGWLMYSYGVKPLAEDIYNGMDVLQRPLPDHLIKATAQGNSRSTITEIDGLRYGQVFTASARMTAGAWVSVTNPNLWLANQMGLVNPVQWANEAIPFSFIVDWFSNLSSVIGSLTDFVGLAFRSSWVSKLYKLEESLTYRGDATLKKRHIYQRGGGLPTPPTFTIAYERFQPQRALNAIALLIGLLPRG